MKRLSRLLQQGGFFLALSFLALSVQASTNAIWSCVIPRIDYSNAPSSRVFADLETISKALDPALRGVRIVYHKPPFERDQIITVKAEKIALYEALFLVTRLLGYPSQQIYLADDVALLCPRQTEGIPVLRLSGFHGRLIDSESHAPVTNGLILTSGLGVTNQVLFTIDGRFIANILHQVRRPHIFGLQVYDPSDELLEVRVQAPGYAELRLLLSVADNLVGPIDIELKPLEQRLGD